ncbi:hypothetical protein BCR43DRAFT_421700, partial [Syncephalastrum racemosum]
PNLISALLQQCPACSQSFNRPTTLPCGYTVCQACAAAVFHKECFSPECDRIHTTALSANILIDQLQHALIKGEPNPDEHYLRSLLECAICCSHFRQPTTTMCGHTFCRNCLVRSLDHMPGCPVCRHTLDWVPPVTPLIREIISIVSGSGDDSDHIHASSDIDVKEGEDDDDDNDDDAMCMDDQHVPIFVGPLAFPDAKCVLHIFEPRYRLMLRRVMASDTGRRFGICFNRRDGSFHPYGTMLELLHVQTLPDGRSLVTAIGSHRLRVKNYSLHDGYHVASIERIDDVDGEQEETLERQQMLRHAAQRAKKAEQPAPSSALNIPTQQPRYPQFPQQRNPTQRPPMMPGMPGAAAYGGGPYDSAVSWAARAHPQTQQHLARSPWLQMHLQGLTPAAQKDKEKGSTKPASNSTPNFDEATYSSTTASPSDKQQRAQSCQRSHHREEQTTDALVRVLSDFIDHLRSTIGHSDGLSDRFSQWLRDLGEPPTIEGPRRNRARFTWWVANLMPLADEEKVGLLSMRTLRERVLTLVKYLDRHEQQWYYWLRSRASGPNNNNSS